MFRCISCKANQNLCCICFDWMGNQIRYMTPTVASVSVHSKSLLFVDYLLGPLWQFETFLCRVQDSLHLLEDGAFCVCVFRQWFARSYQFQTLIDEDFNVAQL